MKKPNTQCVCEANTSWLQPKVKRPLWKVTYGTVRLNNFRKASNFLTLQTFISDGGEDGGDVSAGWEGRRAGDLCLRLRVKPCVLSFKILLLWRQNRTFLTSQDWSGFPKNFKLNIKKCSTDLWFCRSVHCQKWCLVGLNLLTRKDLMRLCWLCEVLLKKTSLLKPQFHFKNDELPSDRSAKAFFSVAPKTETQRCDTGQNWTPVDLSRCKMDPEFTEEWKIIKLLGFDIFREHFDLSLETLDGPKIKRCSNYFCPHDLLLQRWAAVVTPYRRPLWSFYTSRDQMLHLHQLRVFKCLSV